MGNNSGAQDSQDKDSQDKIKVAILASFTLNNFPKVMEKLCFQENLPAEIRLYTSYNFGVQELSHPESGLSQYQPGILFYFLDFKSYFPDYLELLRKSRAQKEELIGEKICYLRELLSNFSQRHPRTFIIVHNFEVPLYSPLGIIDHKEEMGLRSFVRRMNGELEEAFRGNKNVLIFDYDLFLSAQGKKNSFDSRLYYLADMKLHPDYYPALAEQYFTYLAAIRRKPKKCLVLDLDNTLWGGVVGEEGLDNLKLGLTPPGNAFLEFQKVILSLFHKGVILAINSKNNPDDALEVLRRHPYMLLREEHFSAMRLNWLDKAANLKEIAEELNIGTDSLVFVDDDQLNRLLVKELLPEVTVVGLPGDPSLYAETLMNLKEFNSLQLTEVDKARGKMYAEERQRKEMRKEFKNPADFLRSLEMKVEIKLADSFTIPRISQLTNRTNQFNLTARRYSEAEIEEFSRSSRYYVCSIRSWDKLGENGIVGVAILRMAGETVLIDSFLMSCRILGRSIEEVLLVHLLKKARERGAKKVIGEYIPTGKNIQTRDFYKAHGFALYEEKESSILWSLDLENDHPAYPDYLEVKD